MFFMNGSTQIQKGDLQHLFSALEEISRKNFSVNYNMQISNISKRYVYVSMETCYFLLQVFVQFLGWTTLPLCAAIKDKE